MEKANSHAESRGLPQHQKLGSNYQSPFVSKYSPEVRSAAFLALEKDSPHLARHYLIHADLASSSNRGTQETGNSNGSEEDTASLTSGEKPLANVLEMRQRAEALWAKLEAGNKEKSKEGYVTEEYHRARVMVERLKAMEFEKRNRMLEGELGQVKKLLQIQSNEDKPPAYGDVYGDGNESPTLGDNQMSMSAERGMVQSGALDRAISGRFGGQDGGLPRLPNGPEQRSRPDLFRDLFGGVD